MMQEAIPLVAVGIPAAEGAHALEGSVAHTLAQRGIVGELLQAGGESGWIAGGNDEPFDLIGEEVFGAGGCGGEHGAAAGHGLRLDQGEALFDTGQNQDVTGAHALGEQGLWERAGEGDVYGGEAAAEQAANLRLDAADEGEVFAWMAEQGEGLQ